MVTVSKLTIVEATYNAVSEVENMLTDVYPFGSVSCADTYMFRSVALSLDSLQTLFGCF